MPIITCIMLGAEDRILNNIGLCPHGAYIQVVILDCLNNKGKQGPDIIKRR